MRLGLVGNDRDRGVAGGDGLFKLRSAEEQTRRVRRDRSP